ncbi:MAG: hypothetical protein UX37_C0022G0007 [Microgenomates group bacterium GW2011_GWA2_46_16]|nr:MAG: hypothetical protein UX37_C0022G0007 [Microgenomates group bacterium GW2011_GWA2_46_16]
MLKKSNAKKTLLNHRLQSMRRLLQPYLVLAQGDSFLILCPSEQIARQLLQERIAPVLKSPNT